jgi:dephospho-CoA kinase
MSEKEQQILIGLMGTIGAGKTIVSDYLVDKGFYRIVMGDIVREKTKEEGLELTRENLQKIQKKYRDKFGQEYFIKETINRLLSSNKKNLLIDGIRTPTDARVAKEHEAILILIDAPAELRYKRLKERKREGDAQTFDEFKQQESSEWKLFKFEESFGYADYIIENKGTIEELYNKIDDLLNRLKQSD